MLGRTETSRHKSQDGEMEKTLTFRISGPDAAGYAQALADEASAALDGWSCDVTTDRNDEIVFNTRKGSNVNLGKRWPEALFCHQSGCFTSQQMELFEDLAQSGLEFWRGVILEAMNPGGVVGRRPYGKCRL